MEEVGWILMKLGLTTWYYLCTPTQSFCLRALWGTDMHQSIIPLLCRIYPLPLTLLFFVWNILSWSVSSTRTCSRNGTLLGYEATKSLLHSEVVRHEAVADLPLQKWFQWILCFSVWSHNQWGVTVTIDLNEWRLACQVVLNVSGDGRRG